MYPYEIIFGLDLYILLISAGVIACMLLIRLQGDWRRLRARLQNLLLLNTVAAVVLGYGFAVLFQAFYNYMARGVFEIANDTGSTFYGGLIGGTAVFIIDYFIVGRFLFPDGYHVRHFRTVSDMAPACITVAHGLGRLGCLMAGCCHGKLCDAWYCIEMVGVGKVVPVQLFEALFLFGLSAVLLILFKKGKKYEMPIYMMTYAVWRFVAELMRNDYRGATVVDFLTPSQFISVLLLAGGLILLGIELYVDGKKRVAAAEIAAADVAEADASEVETDAADTAEGESHD